MEKLEKGHYYHIYNRGINSMDIFTSESNMSYFITLVNKHIIPKANILSYSILNNHFHLLIEVKSEAKEVAQALSNLFNAYTKAFNKRNFRTGALLERPFKRKKVKDEDYLKQLILYIHKNPENHKLVKDFKTYKFSSYKDYFSNYRSLLPTVPETYNFRNK